MVLPNSHRGPTRLLPTIRARRSHSSRRNHTMTRMATRMQRRWVRINKCRSSSGTRRQCRHTDSTTMNNRRLSIRCPHPSSYLSIRIMRAFPRNIRNRTLCTHQRTLRTIQGKHTGSIKTSARPLRVKGTIMATRCRHRRRRLLPARSYGTFLQGTVRAS